jgi:UDP-N-acetyl-D-mannosaminuronic acid transferase (WecB/TagA/CpsF family)
MVLLWKVFSGRRVERIFGLKFLKRVIARLRSVNLTANSDFYVAPRYGPDVRDDALVAKIDSHPPAHVVVGIGGGVQEKLVLAFLTGDQPPIPMWADRFYLGWLLRLLRQPRVFGPRYLSALKLPALVFRYRENLPPLAKS